MAKKVMTTIGWIVVSIGFFALGLGMVIAVASSTPMM